MNYKIYLSVALLLQSAAGNIANAQDEQSWSKAANNAWEKAKSYLPGAAENYTNELKAILQKVADKGLSPATARVIGVADRIIELVDLGADPNAEISYRDPHTEKIVRLTPLLVLIATSNAQRVQRLIEKGSEINSDIDGEGTTPLVMASGFGLLSCHMYDAGGWFYRIPDPKYYDELIELLINNGARFSESFIADMSPEIEPFKETRNYLYCPKLINSLQAASEKMRFSKTAQEASATNAEFEQTQAATVTETKDIL